MATRLKTVEFWFPSGTTANDNTDTALTQITVYLPENSKVFKSVVLEIVAHDRNTTLGDLVRRQCSLQLASAGYSTVNNTNTLGDDGAQIYVQFSGDYTSYFTTNWTGTSMTCDASVLIDDDTTSALTPSFVNISARLLITYEYDATTTTHIKTVRIPLDCPVGAMGTSKPSAVATIPALDTELPESSKTFRQTTLILQGNDVGASTDLTFNMQIDSNTAYASYAYEHNSSYGAMIRMNDTQSFTTNSTHSFYVWCSSAVGNHMQAWLVVTYEFDSTAASDVFVSTMLPLTDGKDFGGTTSGDYNRMTSDLWIEEAATITTKQIAAYLFWVEDYLTAGLYARVGTGSFVAYTDASGAAYKGTRTMMVRNDSAHTLARGKNTIIVDTYATDAYRVGPGLQGFVLVNYTCAKPSGGHGSENHTIQWVLRPTGTADNDDGTNKRYGVSATAITIPETSYFISNVGLEIIRTLSAPGFGIPYGCMPTSVERLAGEGGHDWEVLHHGLGSFSGGQGIYYEYGSCPLVFKRYPSDPESSRLDIETARVYRVVMQFATFPFWQLSALLTYHAITFTVSGTISGSDAGTVNLALNRYSDNEPLLTTSRSGDGAYSFTWYDNVDSVYVSAYEDATHTGRSANGTAS